MLRWFEHVQKNEQKENWTSMKSKVSEQIVNVLKDAYVKDALYIGN